MRTAVVDHYPYVRVTGTLEVPENLTDEELYEYVVEHWGGIKFSRAFMDDENSLLEVDGKDYEYCFPNSSAPIGRLADSEEDALKETLLEHFFKTGR